jgi:hypothetical protein
MAIGITIVAFVLASAFPTEKDWGTRVRRAWDEALLLKLSPQKDYLWLGLGWMLTTLVLMYLVLVPSLLAW